LRPGFYALASLNGAPLDPDDLAALGLDEPAREFAVRADGLALLAYDPQPGSVDILQNADAVTVFAGFLDEQEELRGALGAAHTDSPVALAGAALERFGREAPQHMIGEWTLLRWEIRPRRLTLLSSENRRHLVYFALGAGVIATAPSALCLGGLRWVGRTLDVQGVAISSSRAGLRHIKAGQTFWEGILEMQPGSRETFVAGSRTTGQASPPDPPERWAGSFEEAIEAIEALGRRIVRQHMSRQGRSAFLLSGGLDSTLLTSWGAYERAPDREMFCLSSMAPAGSGIPDESEWSTAVAQSLAPPLGLPLHGVWPAPGSDLFRPDPEVFEELEGVPDGRFLVHRELDRAALAGGATAFMSGANGEMHVSNGFDVPETRSWLRIKAAGLRDALAWRRKFSGWPAAAFHIRFSPELLAQLPPAWGEVWRKGPPRVAGIHTDWGAGDPPIGISPAARKMAFQPSSGREALRFILPYRDQRLLRLAAQLPVRFLRHEGLTRPIARALLKGRVPDSVRLRTQGRPFSPDYVRSLKAQARGVQARFAVFRESGASRWIDLAWLNAGLERLADSEGETDYKLYYAVHGTALFAEFLVWAGSRNANPD
jgi:asparagine synthase (glutamine-hydrolysing)